jgi:hypothetical protein
MFLAHFSSTGIDALMEMNLTDINFWFNEAVKLNKKMNETS